MKEVADHMVADGYKDAGYEYVSIDVSVHGPSSMYMGPFYLIVAELMKTKHPFLTLPWAFCPGGQYRY